jgi:hypothetical protein
MNRIFLLSLALTFTSQAHALCFTQYCDQFSVYQDRSSVYQDRSSVYQDPMSVYQDPYSNVYIPQNKGDNYNPSVSGPDD